MAAQPEHPCHLEARRATQAVRVMAPGRRHVAAAFDTERDDQLLEPRLLETSQGLGAELPLEVKTLRYANFLSDQSS